MAGAFPEFRLGSVLATSFTATLTERCGDRVERIPTTQRLKDWLAVNGLPVDACSSGQLASAWELREAIHRAATAGASGAPLPFAAVGVINDHSGRGRAAAVLTPEGGRRWALRSRSGVTDALGVIAVDAIDVVSGARDGRLALCASPTCQAAFFDTSRSRTRRWCDMNTCGNREKKARFRASRHAP